MIGLRKFAVCLICFSFIVISVFTNKDNAQSVQSSPKIAKQKIILDAGHGGFDGGAEASDGTKEKDINLSIALKTKQLLEQGGFDVIMIRSEDTGIETDSNQPISKRKVSDMKKRLEIISSNPQAVFVSIHLNKFTTSSAIGAQVFYSPNCDSSEILAQSIQQRIVGLIQPKNTRTIKQADKSIYLMKNAQIPAVIVECGFLSNPTELALLKSDDYQCQTAFSIYCGILDYYDKENSLET